MLPVNRVKINFRRNLRSYKTVEGLHCLAARNLWPSSIYQNVVSVLNWKLYKSTTRRVTMVTTKYCSKPNCNSQNQMTDVMKGHSETVDKNVTQNSQEWVKLRYLQDGISSTFSVIRTSLPFSWNNGKYSQNLMNDDKHVMTNVIIDDKHAVRNITGSNSCMNLKSLDSTSNVLEKKTIGNKVEQQLDNTRTENKKADADIKPDIIIQSDTILDKITENTVNNLVTSDLKVKQSGNNSDNDQLQVPFDKNASDQIDNPIVQKNTEHVESMLSVTDNIKVVAGDLPESYSIPTRLKLGAFNFFRPKISENKTAINVTIDSNTASVPAQTIDTPVVDHDIQVITNTDIEKHSVNKKEKSEMPVVNTDSYILKENYDITDTKLPSQDNVVERLERDIDTVLPLIDFTIGDTKPSNTEGAKLITITEITEKEQSFTSRIPTRIFEGVNYFNPWKNSSSSTMSKKTEELLDLKQLTDGDKSKLSSNAKKSDSDKKQKPEADKSYLNYFYSLPASIQLSFFSKQTETQEQIAKAAAKKELISESVLLDRTRDLSDNFLKATSSDSKLQQLDDLCGHVLKYPEFRHIALTKLESYLLHIRDTETAEIVGKTNQALTLFGHHSPPRGPGIRMLSIDGGGTRGLIALEVMERLENECKRPIHEMFDFVIGSSTGALIGALVFLLRKPLDQCKELYIDRSVKMFGKRRGMTSSLQHQSMYDVKIFEDVVRAEVGEKAFIEYANDLSYPKMAMTGTLVNVPKWKMFVFRNYNLHPAMVTEYSGRCDLKVWEAIRASGSAPIYYKEFRLGEHVFRDGGVIANNPTAIGIHECKLLWPYEKFQCIVSIGNGRYEPVVDAHAQHDGSMLKLAKDLMGGFIDSATDTEGVHTILKDTLQPSRYFRFSPYLSENYDLSEIKTDKIGQMLQEANVYLTRNQMFIQAAVKTLTQERSTINKIAVQTRSVRNRFLKKFIKS